ncbi:ATP-dependent DNA helicase [Nephila pilipes]|uniref:ATP-dependent DNA helicase n=1 Tax=Nephila pilipes TaxID=299642 RepID=A0A8X6PTQ0_NEPPI|nr:ATP-dependent DNA helicase [Nephila pilipes]
MYCVDCILSIPEMQNATIYDFSYMRIVFQRYLKLKNYRSSSASTFQATCRALGLLEDDTHWNRTLEEASISDSPHKIRELFAIVIVFCQVRDPIKLWGKYWESLSVDIRRQMERERVEI